MAILAFQKPDKVIMLESDDFHGVFEFRPLDSISLYYLTTDNLVSGKNYERRFVLGYHHQCFNILGSIHSKGRDNSYRIILQLPGLSL